MPTPENRCVDCEGRGEHDVPGGEPGALTYDCATCGGTGVVDPD